MPENIDFEPEPEFGDSFENEMPEEFMVPRSFFEDSKKVDIAIQRTKSAMEGSFEKYVRQAPTAELAARLHLFNLFLTNPSISKEEIERAVKKMSHLVREEKEASRKINPLPTVGFELEVPDRTITIGMERAFSNLGLWSGTDTTDIYEFRNEPSFSAHTQSRILSEIGKWGFTELAKSGVELPLHLNFGIPDDVREQFNYDFQTNLKINHLTSMVTAAYVSPSRILDNNWSKPFDVHPLNLEELVWQKKINARLEVRTPSFEEASDYRMFIEMQALVASLVANVRETIGLSSVGMDSRMSEEWRRFEAEAVKFFEAQLGNSDILLINDGDRRRVYNRKTDGYFFEKDARNIVSHSARKVLDIIG